MCSISVNSILSHFAKRFDDLLHLWYNKVKTVSITKSDRQNIDQAVQQMINDLTKYQSAPYHSNL